MLCSAENQCIDIVTSDNFSVIEANHDTTNKFGEYLKSVIAFLLMAVIVLGILLYAIWETLHRNSKQQERILELGKK